MLIDEYENGLNGIGRFYIKPRTWIKWSLKYV